MLYLGPSLYYVYTYHIILHCSQAGRNLTMYASSSRFLTLGNRFRLIREYYSYAYASPVTTISVQLYHLYLDATWRIILLDL